MTDHQQRTLNQAAYARLKGSLAKDYGAGRFVAIRAGEVAADAASFGELQSVLARMNLDPAQVMIVQAGAEYPETVVIFALAAI